MRGRIPALDGLRGVAILLVVVFHAWPDVMPGGSYGVTVFFVLSGYLITSILVSEQGRLGRMRLGRFYKRRAARLLPALFLMLAVVYLVAGWDEVWPGLFYVANYAMVDGWRPEHTQHLWSLAVEEHFYFLWPLILIAAKQRRRQAGVVLFVVFTCWRFYNIAEAPVRAYLATDTVAYALLAGCVLAMFPKRQLSPMFGYVGLAGIVSLAAAVSWLAPGYLEADMLVVVSTAAVITAPPRILEVRWLVWVGVMSYGIYLWHEPLLSMLGVAGVPVSFAAAAISFYWWEQPVKQWVSRNPPFIGKVGEQAKTLVVSEGT